MVDSPRSRSWDDRDPRAGRDGRDSLDGRPTRPAPDDWDGPPRRAYRRPEPRLEQRLDQWMTAGRQLVDGVAGARPGSRPSARGAGAAAGPRLRPGDLGRWVENKIDWLLEDDDGWREPWQEPRRSIEPPQRPSEPRVAPIRPPAEVVPPRGPAASASRRRPLEAVSLRGTPLLPQAPAGRPGPAPADRVVDPADGSGLDQEWPDPDSFTVSRWRRDDAPVRTPRDSEPWSGSAAPSPRSADPRAPLSAPPGRAMPRSSRRRSG